MNEFREIITNTLDQHTKAMNEKMETISSTLDRHTECFTELNTHINDIQDSLRDLHVNAPPSPPPQHLLQVPRPRATTDRAKKLAVMTHIRNNIEGIEQDDINSILDGIGRSALSACRAFAGRSEENSVRGWGQLTGGEQLNLCETMYQELIHDDPRLTFFHQCTRLWPMEFIVQPKWTQKSKTARVARSMRQIRANNSNNPTQ
jgi:hypothetical protein